MMTLAAWAASSPLRPVDLRCEYLQNPLGIDATQPRLSWKLDAGSSSRRGLSQTACQVIVASSRAALNKDAAELWDSGQLKMSQSIHVVYAGRPLRSQQECWWKVRVWDQDGNPTGWSEPARWTMGLLVPGDWQAKWIGLDEGTPVVERPELASMQWIWFPEGSPAQNAPIGERHFRKVFEVPAQSAVKRATAIVTADNGFDLYINGRKAGSGGDFHQLVEMDLTPMVKAGPNCIAVLARNIGDNPNPAGLMGVVRIEFASGSPLVIPTGADWKSSVQATSGWASVSFDDASWSPARVLGKNGDGPWGKIGNSDEARRLAARMLRHEFNVGKKVTRAMAYICGLGLFECRLNGAKVGNAVLEPALSEYNKRVFYVTYDVTSQIKSGANALGVWLGNGRFYAPRSQAPIGTLGFGYPRLRLQLHLEYADGSFEDVLSDESWKLTTDGPIFANNEYDGEEYDARREFKGWDAPRFEDSAWRRVQLVDAPKGVLRAQMQEPIRVTQTLKPKSVLEIQPGVFIYDMGQNMVGWCQLKVKGPEGATVTLRHAETLKPDGSLYLDNIRGAKVTDRYTLRGKGTEVYEPRFTYHGFRYVEMTGYPGKPSLDALTGCVVHDDLPVAGFFECSNDLVNRIYHNVVWGTRGNYRSIPTDCPQRDERQGWLGDRSAESKGETYLYDTSTLYSKWVRDIGDAQQDNGSIPDVAPSYWQLYSDNVTWPSSAVIIPGSLYDQYGDQRLILTHYPVMQKWIEHMSGYIKDGLMPRDTYGDWCVPPEAQTLIHSQDPARKTSAVILGTTYFYHDLRLMARYARIIGRYDDAAKYEKSAAELRDALNKQYLNTTSHQYDNGSQTSSVLPLAFGMVPDDQRQAVFDRLVDKITRETKGHIGTGLIGGQWLMRTLTSNGRPDVAWGIATQMDYPSWGYMVSKGATTVWELWNGDTADPAMNSGNHVMLVGDLIIWMYENLAGIAPDPGQPAFKHVIMRPTPVEGLDYVKASHRTSYGQIASAWRKQNGAFEWNIQLPPNTTATLEIPVPAGANVTEGGKPAKEVRGARFLGTANGIARFQVGSGSYHFVVK